MRTIDDCCECTLRTLHLRDLRPFSKKEKDWIEKHVPKIIGHLDNLFYIKLDVLKH